jgi:hypothetical protein
MKTNFPRYPSPASSLLSDATRALTPKTGLSREVAAGLVQPEAYLGPVTHWPAEDAASPATASDSLASALATAFHISALSAQATSLRGAVDALRDQR